MFLLLSMVFTGMSLCVFLWWVLQPAIRRDDAATTQRGPLSLRLSCPWVSALRPGRVSFVPWRTRSRLAQGLRLAALDALLTPSELVALQTLVFLLIAGLLCAVFYLLWFPQWFTVLPWACLGALLCAMLPRVAVRSRAGQRQQNMLRELPFLLDMTTLCVEAGLNLHGALQRAAEHGPDGPLRQELHYTLAEIRAGAPRMEALDNLAARTGLIAMASLVSALKQADQTGSSLGPILRAQADQRRSEQFLRAEELAMKAPVKMLFPLVTCIFPCTFLVIGFPVVLKVVEGAW